MAKYQKIILTGSTNGRPIEVNALVAENGTAVHAAGAATTDVDELWLWATNTNTSARLLTLKMGVTTSAGEVTFTVPAQDGLYTVVPGLPFNNSMAIQAHATASGDLHILGFVNRVVSAT